MILSDLILFFNLMLLIAANNNLSNGENDAVWGLVNATDDDQIAETQIASSEQTILVDQYQMESKNNDEEQNITESEYNIEALSITTTAIPNSLPDEENLLNKTQQSGEGENNNIDKINNELQQPIENVNDTINEIFKDAMTTVRTKEIYTDIVEATTTDFPDADENINNIYDKTNPQEEYTLALKELREAVLSLLPLKEHMALASECQEGRENIMHNIMSEMRGRIVQLEKQIYQAREAEKECHTELRELRAQDLEKKLSVCETKLEERNAPNISALVRVEIVNKKHNASTDEENFNGTSLYQLTNLLQESSSNFLNIIKDLDTKLTTIYSISKDTLKFVESVQESEVEENDEITRLSGLVNASEITINELNQKLKLSVENIKSQCSENITIIRKECTNDIMRASTDIKDKCETDAVKMQTERLSYIIGLHIQHNASLISAQEECLTRVENEIEIKCQERLLEKEVELREECERRQQNIFDVFGENTDFNTTQEKDNCDERLSELQERCDAELRLLNYTPAIDIRFKTADNDQQSAKCKGYPPILITNNIELEANETLITIEDKVYVISNTNALTRENASKLCRERGMWLLTIDSNKTYQEMFINKIYNQSLLQFDEKFYLWTSGVNTPEGLQWECDETVLTINDEPDLDHNKKFLVVEIDITNTTSNYKINYRAVGENDYYNLACAATIFQV